MKGSPLFSLALVVFCGVGLVAAGDLEITFVGNEGFLLESAERKVLIDALVSRSMPRYVRQSERLRGDLESASAPFDGVDLVLATHRHGDHFDATTVRRHLLANPSARFVSTPQAVAELGPPDDLESRVQARYPPAGRIVDVPGLGVELLRLHHGLDRRPPIENLGFIVDVGGWRVLHVGDTEVTGPDLEEFDPLERPIDVAFLPIWYLAEEHFQGVLRERFRPDRVVVMHLAPEWSDSDDPWAENDRRRVTTTRRVDPDVIVFERPGETRRLSRSRPQPAPSGDS